jgi:hypothetical protein
MFEDEYIKATGRIKRILEENSETKLDFQLFGIL